MEKMLCPLCTIRSTGERSGLVGPRAAGRVRASIAVASSHGRGNALTYSLYSFAAFPPKMAALSLSRMSRLDNACFIAGMLPIACG